MSLTYEPIATTTITTGQVEVLFSSIPQTYTDLVVVVSATQTGSDGLDMRVGNGSADTGNNYSFQVFRGNGSAASAYRVDNYSALEIGTVNSTVGVIIAHLMNYSNTTTYKSFIGRNNNTAWSQVDLRTGTWRNTAAINVISIKNGGYRNHAVGSTFTLYGIKAE